MRVRFWRRVMSTVAVTALVMAGISSFPFERAAEAASSPTSATAVMVGLELGTSPATPAGAVGWGLSSLVVNATLNTDPAEIASALTGNVAQLDALEADLTSLAQTPTVICALENPAVSAAVARIKQSTRELQRLESAGESGTVLNGFARGVLNSEEAIPAVMNDLNHALPGDATGGGIISGCLSQIPAPAAGTGGDIAYYGTVADLTDFFYGYQVIGLNLIVEANHYFATVDWLHTNPPSLDASAVASLCQSTAGCRTATDWTAEVYHRLQTQFARAGAPYTTPGETITVNGTPYLFASSLETFTAQTGVLCPTPLTSAVPCGPTAGTNQLSSFPPSSRFVGRESWTPATAQAWRDVTQWWSNPTQTLGGYLTGLGFEHTADSTKIVLTPTTYTAAPAEIIDGTYRTIFTAPAVCFLDTRLIRDFSAQPFCHNGTTGEGTYGSSIILIDDTATIEGCHSMSAMPLLANEPTNGFYTGTYHYPQPGCPGGWANNTQPGWVLDNGTSAVQYLWPMFDMSTAVCTTNADGTLRKAVNPAGVFTMCGTDFDVWFAGIVPAPADAPAPVAPPDHNNLPAAAVPVQAAPRFTG